MGALNDDDLTIYRLRVRAELLEKLFAALYAAVLPLIPGGRGLGDSIRSATMIALESHARFADDDLVRCPVPQLEGLNESERALLADEFRDVVFELKAFVENLSDDNREKT